jgi:hypothetical protein
MELEPRQDRLQGTGTPDTRIFSPLTVPGLCVTIGHQVNESKCFPCATLALNFPIRSHSDK